MTIWLTGCTSGLGRALVPEFMKAGHTVIGCGQNEIALEHLKKEFPMSHFLAVDVSSDQSVSEFCSEALAAAGAPDLVLNNAAIINHPAPLWEIGADEFDHLTAVNINGVANVLRHALPSMLAEGKGIIVNLSSGWGRSTSPEVAPYCASKWAIEGLTKSLAEELPSGMAAVAFNPGIIATEMLRKCMGSDAESFSSPEAWATTAAPFLLGLTPADNGQSLTAP
ncbi:MAG: SDR family NAD(P)-dependent oxidoreductase [Akkermansiaceae bacterium]|nr:SDR family NAD(P)-dependent oxidoreductase [Akkermansiaceae bacterium]